MTLPIAKALRLRVILTGNSRARAAIEHFLLAVSTIRNADVQQLCGVSPATANRILNEFCKEGKLERVRVGRYSSYRKPK